jgi:hypothetical protein
VGEYEVWTVPEGASLFVEGESDSVVSVRALALGKNHMIFGTDIEQLKNALAAGGSGPRWKQDATWSRLWKSLNERHPQPGALWSMTRLEQVLEPAYQRAVRKPEKEAEDGLAAALWRILLFGTADEEADVPYAAAPSYDRVKAALPPAGTFLSESEQGFHITTSAIRGAGAN